MTPRLEAAFASRIAQLPERTRDLVVLVALHHDGAVPEVLAAGEALTGEPVTLGDLDPAVEVGIVEVARARVRFGHPLVRSAVHQHVSPALRQHAHLVLARCASTRHEQVWHRAAAADEPDEDLARELDSLSVSAQDRHALEAAVRARVEAVRLSEEPGERARRQLGLVDLYVDLGQQDRARATLGAVDPAVLTPPERIWLAWVTDQLTASAWGGRDRLLEIARTARELHDIGDPRALPVLLSALLQCWWSNSTPRTRSVMAETADVVVPAGPGGSNLMHAAVTALAAPTQRGAAVLTAYAAAEPGALPTEAELLLTLALGASGVGDHVRAAAIFQASVRASRREGRFANLGQSLVGAAWSELHLGRVRRCAVLSDESLRLGRDLFQPLWQATALLARGAARALSGEVDVARADSDRAEQLIVEVGANPVLAQVRAVRGLAALGEGRYGDAYAQLRGVFDPRDVAHQENFRTFLVAELAEAAHGCGQQEEARDLLADVEAAWAGVPSPILRAGLLVARPLLAGGPRVEQHFRAALDDGLASWPMHRARVHLRYGAWLRRERRVGEARAHLREAHETFAALGAAPWADLASQELRAAGELPPVRTSAAWEHLTAQELQIALLAAEGFTNRQIGERLFLSHRTVGSHLYHIYPKLGIASRVQLASALAGVETDRPAPPDRAQAGTIS